MSKKIAVLLSGYGGAGKTTLARHLAENYGFTHIGERDIADQEAGRLGLTRREFRAVQMRERDPHLYDVLKDDNVPYIREKANGADRLVFDFAESPEAISRVQELFPSHALVSVFVRTPKITRWLSTIKRARSEGDLTPVVKRIGVLLKKDSLRHSGSKGSLREMRTLTQYTVRRFPRPFHNLSFKSMDRVMELLGFAKSRIKF